MAGKKKKKKNSLGSKAAASAVAAVTAAGVMVGGAYASPEELLNDGPAPIVQTLVNSDVQIDNDSGPDDFEEELAGAEEEKRGVRYAVRKRMRMAPAGVRALLGMPLWCIGTAAIMALSSLWAGALSPAAALVLSWVGLALLAVLVYTLAVKTVFPDMPLKKILNRRSILTLVSLCLLFGAADAMLPLFWEDYQKLSYVVKALGSLACAGVPAAFLLRRHRRQKPETIEAEPVEIPEPEPTLQEREASARALVTELADSVSRRL